MIIDFYEAADVFLDALIIWVVIGSAIATVLGLGLIAVLWWLTRTACRAIRCSPRRPSWARGRRAARRYARQPLADYEEPA